MSSYVRKGSRRNTSSPYRVSSFTPSSDIITCRQGRMGWQNTTSHGGTNINQTVLARQTGWRENCLLQIARAVTLAASLWNADVRQISVRMIQNKFKNRVAALLPLDASVEAGEQTIKPPQFSQFHNRDSWANCIRAMGQWLPMTAPLLTRLHLSCTSVIMVKHQQGPDLWFKISGRQSSLSHNWSRQESWKWTVGIAFFQVQLERIPDPELKNCDWIFLPMWDENQSGTKFAILRGKPERAVTMSL